MLEKPIKQSKFSFSLFSKQLEGFETKCKQSLKENHNISHLDNFRKQIVHLDDFISYKV